MLGNSLGAFVAVAALTESEQTFVIKASALLNALEFDVLDVEHISIVDSPLLASIGAEMRRQIEALSPSNSITYGSFHSYS